MYEQLQLKFCHPIADKVFSQFSVCPDRSLDSRNIEVQKEA